MNPIGSADQQPTHHTLSVTIHDPGGAHPPTQWPDQRPVTFGRGPDCDVTVPADNRASRHMGTFVPADGVWWLVVPVPGPDEQPKRPVIVEAADGRWQATVSQGGWLALPPGHGWIQPRTTDGTRLEWAVQGRPPRPVRSAARLDNTAPAFRRPDAAPDPAVLASEPTAETAEAWQREQERLEAELIASHSGTIRSAPAPRLTNRVLDYLITASTPAWRDPTARMLTCSEIAEQWSITDQPVSAGAVQRALLRGLALFSREWVPDPIVWSQDPSRVIAVLRQCAILTDGHYQWQDLHIDVPGDPPDPTPRPDGTVGPRPQADRPHDWKPEC